MKTIENLSIPAGLYLVATPIGNLRDITLRALDILNAADFVACEDTRVSGKLLQAYAIKAKLIKYNDHTTAQQRDNIVNLIAEGKSVALISDAGTPLISDPGYKLVQACYEAGLTVTTLPGANAVLSALQLSGQPSDRFTFGGFAPQKSAARQAWLQEFQNNSGTLVFYETGPRLAASLADMAHVLGGKRNAAVVREITKLYEESRRGSLDELVTHYNEAEAPRGEIAVILGPALEVAASEDDIDALLQKALAQMSVRDAAAHVAQITGVAKKQIYARALNLSHDNSEE
jgi:16S rRNA (cytidine1402-2'-O)-methyltransferase